MKTIAKPTPAEREQVIVLARSGDQSAFETLVVNYQDYAVAIAYGWLGDRELAGDVAQEAFLEVYHRLSQLRNPAAFSGWLQRIIIKQCDRITRRKALPEHLLVQDHTEPDPVELIASTAEQQNLRRAVETLPQTERIVIALSYMAESTGPEIADFLDLPLSTIKARLRRAKAHLREFTETSMSQTMNRLRPSSDPTLSLEIRFYLALRQGDLSRVRKLIKEDPGLLETPQDWGSDLVMSGTLPFATKASPLITAIEQDNLQMMELLLSEGADVNGACECTTGESPLWAAVLLNRESHARILLDAGAQPNQRSAAGNMPLHLAAMRGFTGMARLLLEYGADPLLRDSGSKVPSFWLPRYLHEPQPERTALEWAVAMGNEDMIELLNFSAEPECCAAANEVELTDDFIFTGLRALDLFSPLLKGGLVRIPFKAGVGMVVLLGEIAHRFIKLPMRRMIWTGFTAPPYDLKDWQAEMAEFDLTSRIFCGLSSYEESAENRRACFETAVEEAERLRDSGSDVLVIVQSVTGFESDVDASLLRLKKPAHSGSITTLLITPFPETQDSDWQAVTAPVDGQILFDRTRARNHLYPALNPVGSQANEKLSQRQSDRHRQLAEQVRQTLINYSATDPEFAMESETDCEPEAAIALLRYLCQPFYVSAPFTGTMGESTRIDKLLDDVESILAAGGS